MHNSQLEYLYAVIEVYSAGSGTRCIAPVEGTWSISGFAVNFGPPPADADKQETPVVKELRLFTLEGMADELEGPSHKEKRERVGLEAVNKDAGDEQNERKQDCRYPQGMADTVYRVLMAGGVLRNPLFVGAVAQHGESMIHLGRGSGSRPPG
jgi:hypothetical protein